MKKSRADLRGRVDLHARHRPAREGDRPRRERHPGVVEGVGEPVREQRLHAGPAREDLDRADAASGGVAVASRRDVASDLADDPSQCPDAEHQSATKKGSDM